MDPSTKQQQEQPPPEADKFKSVLLSKSRTKQLREQEERRENKRKRLMPTTTEDHVQDQDQQQQQQQQQENKQPSQGRVRASVYSSPEKIDELLSHDIILQSSPKETWCKLGKVAKIECLMRYAEKYAEEHRLDSDKEHKVKTRLLELLEKNQLDRSQTVVIYDRESRSIKGIQIPL